MVLFTTVSPVPSRTHHNHRHHKQNVSYRVQWLTSVISPTQEAEIQRIRVQGQPRQKVSETPPNPISTNMLGVVVHTCHPSTQER
jgi:hypothetical protein